MWENQNLIGTTLISRNLLDEDSDEDYDIDESVNLHVHFRSAFFDILQLENGDAHKAYLSCQRLQIRQSKQYKKSEAEKAWMGVEKKLRDVVVGNYTKLNMIDFLQSVELLLLYFQMNSTPPPETHIPKNFLRHLRKPITCSQSSMMVCLKDSPFHRLFLHTACQYHGLLSKSVTANDGSRNTIISRKKMETVSNHGISLVSFLNSSGTSKEIVRIN